MIHTLLNRCESNLIRLVELILVFQEKNYLGLSFSVDSAVNFVMGMCKAPSRSNFTEITLRHGCSAVRLLHIFRTTEQIN